MYETCVLFKKTYSQNARNLRYLEHMKYILPVFAFTGFLFFCEIGVSHAYVGELSELEPAAGASHIEKVVEDKQNDFAQFLIREVPKEVTLTDSSAVNAFYEARDYEPVWVKKSLLGNTQISDLLDLWKASWRHGFNPSQYHITRIEELNSFFETGDNYLLDVLVTDAIIRYGQDLLGMRVRAKDIGVASRYWRQAPSAIEVIKYVSDYGDAAQALRRLEPQGKLYRSLQKELEQLYSVQDEAPQVKVRLDGVIRPGDEHRAVSSVRERMGLDPSRAVEGTHYYDQTLVDAVVAFQKAHGLTPDGVVGKHTAKLMNMSSQDRIDQILANLERLRWIEQQKPMRYVMVNVPSATLWAIDKGRVQFEMPVVVGRKKRQTNLFTTEITGVRVNPTWTVPPTIKKEDYLPELQKDPYYLADRGIEISYDGLTLDPIEVDWTALTIDDVKAYRMVQGSGSSNPLGRFRVVMDNPYNIYLHDTPTKSYFKRASRALSSGCIRMRDAEKFTDFVLAHNDLWTPERKQEILAEEKMREIRAEKPLPVYIVYQTVWHDDRGRLVYGNDIYGRDAALLALLKRQKDIPLQVKQGPVRKKTFVPPAQKVDFSGYNE